MSAWTLLSSLCFLLLAGLHSGLGERFLLRPLFRSEAFKGLALGRRFGERTFRFAWHLTSLGWVAAALLVARVPEARPILAGLALVSGVYIFVASRGQHLAWPLFGLGALGAARAAGWGGGLGPLVGATLGVVLAAIAVLHVFWLAGGRLGLGAVVPTKDGAPLLRPGSVLTVVVVVGLFGLSGLAFTLGGFVHPGLTPAFLRTLATLSALVFLARTYGDFRTTGVMKRLRGTPFAHWDDRLYTPLSFLFAAAFITLLDVGV